MIIFVIAIFASLFAFARGSSLVGLFWILRSFIKFIHVKSDTNSIVIRAFVSVLKSVVFSIDLIEQCLRSIVTLEFLGALLLRWLLIGTVLSASFFLFTLAASTSFLLDKGSSAIFLFFLFITHDKLDHVFHLEGVTVNCRLHILLLLGSLDNLFLDCALSDDPINCDWFSLADSMSSICSLLIHSWVPIVVIENDGVGSDQIDS